MTPIVDHLVRPLVVVALLLGTWAVAQTAGTDRVLERLALRLLAPDDPDEIGLALEPGVVPADLPFALPLPEAADLVGSLVRRDADGRLLEALIVFDRSTSSRA